MFGYEKKKGVIPFGFHSVGDCLSSDDKNIFTQLNNENVKYVHMYVCMWIRGINKSVLCV